MASNWGRAGEPWFWKDLLILKDLHPTNCWMKPKAYCLSVWISSKMCSLDDKFVFFFSGCCDVFSSVEREPWIIPFLRIIITTFSDQFPLTPPKYQQTVNGWSYPGGGARFCPSTVWSIFCCWLELLFPNLTSFNTYNRFRISRMPIWPISTNSLLTFGIPFSSFWNSSPLR